MTRIMHPLRLLLVFSILCISEAALAAPQWQPVADAVFLQEIGSQVPTEKPVWAVAVYNDVVYLGFGHGIARLTEENTLEPIAEVTGFVEHMRTAAGALWVFTDKKLFRFDGDTWTSMEGQHFRDVCELHGTTYVLSTQRLQTYADGGLKALPGVEDAPGQLFRLAPYAESLYCLANDRVVVFDGQRFDYTNVLEFGALPSKDARDMVSMGNRLVVATYYGLGEIRGTAATSVLGADGLPFDECLTMATGFANDYWLGTTKGAIRVVDGDYHYFIGARWLPDDKVNAIATSGDTVYLATGKGLGIIRYEPYTLLKKAAYYEQHLESWGQKRMAFVHKLEWNSEDNAWMREVSDNDVGWSTHYWASQAFKYAVTGDAEARANAVAGFNALKWAEEITPIDGFPARSIWAVGETGNRATGGSGGYPAEWNPTDDGKWAWKGDTSSDETDAHFYYASIFYELVADEAEKEQVRDHLRRVAGHIKEQGWVLRDLDGEPTVWGRWDLEYLNSPKGSYAWGLNGMEALNYMRTAHAITGDETFQEGVEELVRAGYTRAIVHQKLVEPRYLFHSDDRLAFYTYYTLLRYETHPGLRGIYARSLERSWAIERIEHNPWFNFIYGDLTGNPCEIAEATEHLRAWPLDLRRHSYDLTHLRNLHPEPGYLPYTDGVLAISPRTVGGQRWTNSYLDLKGGNGAQAVDDPSGWLDAYWMGRHLGMILPPETDDPALTTVPPTDVRPGALPYDGPPAPNVLED